MGLQDQQPGDMRATLAVSQEEARFGSSRVINLPGGRTTTVVVPAGTRDGQELRLAGQGFMISPGGPAGDLILRVLVVASQAIMPATITRPSVPSTPLRATRLLLIMLEVSRVQAGLPHPCRDHPLPLLQPTWEAAICLPNRPAPPAYQGPGDTRVLRPMVSPGATSGSAVSGSWGISEQSGLWSGAGATSGSAVPRSWGISERSGLWPNDNAELCSATNSAFKAKTQWRSDNFDSGACAWC